MSEKTNQLRLGIPKGSLQETTQKLFVRAGYDLRISGRSYYPDIDDPELQCILIRPQEMARYVGQGILDCAITGLDWILENDADVAELADLRAPWPNYGVVRWVLASKEDSPFHTVKDLAGRRIATEAVGMTRRFLAQHGVTANVEFSWGAQVGEFGHIGAGFQNPVEARDGAVEDALPDVAGHLLRPDQNALDLGVVDVRVVGTARNAQIVARAHEQLLGGFLQAAFGNAKAQLSGFIVHVAEPERVDAHCP